MAVLNLNWHDAGAFTVPELVACLKVKQELLKIDKTLDMNMAYIAHANIKRKKGSKMIEAFPKEEATEVKEGKKEEKDLLFEKFKKLSS